MHKLAVAIGLGMLLLTSTVNAQTIPPANCVPPGANPTSKQLKAAIQCLQTTVNKIVGQLATPTPPPPSPPPMVDPKAVHYGDPVVLYRPNRDECFAFADGLRTAVLPCKPNGRNKEDNSPQKGSVELNINRSEN